MNAITLLYSNCARPLRAILHPCFQDKKFVVDLSDHKFILIWVPPFGVRETYDFDKSICGNCSITYDRTKVS